MYIVQKHIWRGCFIASISSVPVCNLYSQLSAASSQSALELAMKFNEVKVKPLKDKEGKSCLYYGERSLKSWCTDKGSEKVKCHSRFLGSDHLNSCS